MTRDSDDAELMARYQAGDLAAFELLYRRNKDSLYRYLLRLARDTHAAEEVFQEAWGKIVQARARYRPTARFRTFLFRVAHNCFVDHLRRNERHRHAATVNPDEALVSGDVPEVQAEREQMRLRINDALASLPDEQREAWLMHEEGGLSVNEVAEATGVNRETAKSRIRYANRKLQNILVARDDGGVDPTSSDESRDARKVVLP